MGDFLDRWNPSTLQVILFVIGGGLLWLGQDWGVVWANDVGVSFMGALLIAIGMQSMLPQLALLREPGWANIVEGFRGGLAILWSSIFVLGGALIVAVVIMQTFVPSDVGERWRSWLAGSTGMGVLLSLVGMLLMLNGLIRALAGSPAAAFARMGKISRALDRLIGAIWLGVGMTIVAIGLVLLVAPGWIGAAERYLVGLVQ